MHCSLLEEMYTGPDTINRNKIIAYMRLRHPDEKIEHIQNVWHHQRKALLSIAILQLTPTDYRILKRDYIGKRLERFSCEGAKKQIKPKRQRSPKREIEPSITVTDFHHQYSTKVIPPLPAVVGESYTDKVIRAMAATIKQLRLEIAELLDERSKSLAVIHEASAAVARSKESVLACSRLPPGIDLEELGVTVEPMEVVL